MDRDPVRYFVTQHRASVSLLIACAIGEAVIFALKQGFGW